MTRATRFLLGEPNADGRTVETLVRASDEWLERHHDWVQWAFPNQQPSGVNGEAPVWTADEARALPAGAVENLRRLLARFAAFLDRTDHWRAHADHNHARITRALLCLRDAGLHAEARALYAYVSAAPEPGARARSYWQDAAPE